MLLDDIRALIAETDLAPFPAPELAPERRPYERHLASFDELREDARRAYIAGWNIGERFEDLVEKHNAEPHIPGSSCEGFEREASWLDAKQQMLRQCFSLEACDQFGLWATAPIGVRKDGEIVTWSDEDVAVFLQTNAALDDSAPKS